MAEATIQLCLRGDTAAEWAAKNPVLEKFEVGIEEAISAQVSPRCKIGDGAQAWQDLPYLESPAAIVPFGPLPVTGQTGESFPLPVAAQSLRGVHVLVANPGPNQYPVVPLFSSMYQLASDGRSFTMQPDYALSVNDQIEGLACGQAGAAPINTGEYEEADYESTDYPT